MTTRYSTKSDLPAISLILKDTELFPSELLEEMIEPFFQDPDSPDKWFVYEDDQLGVVGFGFCRPEPFTEGTWNLLAIGVRTAHQGRGIGKELLQFVEQELATERLLLIDTSSMDAFEKTRAFYIKRGYDLVATIPGYWAENDDKIIFSKRLG